MQSPSPFAGRHELGQNDLRHRPTLRRIRALVAATEGPILEIGPGNGAITDVLLPLRRHITAVEIDPRRARRLERRHRSLRVVIGDVLRMRITHPTVVGNVPFHLTTPILRRLLHEREWTDAILITQWEVARKRAGIGGRTLMTAQADPWFSFTLHGRVPSAGFVPRPSVDGGILHISRRRHPLIPTRERSRYTAFVRRVFTGRGDRLDQVLRRTVGLTRGDARSLLGRLGITSTARPRDLTPEQWVALWTGIRAHR